ncbi:hypothetical protein Taro_009923 [Colocasia esculenta]|uniref:Uncharacterized protein n=1 Tax=Colocasia esculenta TaxID=4460 RepID=A0A843TXN3_COLES|nr:hypothetical protein [Colocasia esculenta]
MTVLLMTACQVLHSELCAMMTPHGFGAHAADPGERLLAVGLPTRSIRDKRFFASRARLTIPAAPTSADNPTTVYFIVCESTSVLRTASSKRKVMDEPP